MIKYIFVWGTFLMGKTILVGTFASEKIEFFLRNSSTDNTYFYN